MKVSSMSIFIRDQDGGKINAKIQHLDGDTKILRLGDKYLVNDITFFGTAKEITNMVNSLIFALESAKRKGDI